MRPLVVFVALVAGSAHADVSAPALAPPNDRIIIVEAQAAARCRPGKYFTPSAVDVARIDARVPERLREIAKEQSYLGGRARDVLSLLPRSKRFYTGELENNERVVAIDGVCEHIPDFFAGSRCAPEVADGGACFWHLRFDLKRRTFVFFATNGEA